MKAKYIDIAGGWAFIFVYNVGLRDLDDLSSWLEALGCTEKQIVKASRSALGTNSGFLFSNDDLRMSLMCISDATSESQWWNTVVHEIGHLQVAICRYYGVQLGSEESEYLQGFIMQKIFQSVKLS